MTYKKIIEKNEYLNNSEKIQEYLDKKQNLSDSTKKNYIAGLDLFTKANNKGFDEIINEIKNQQKNRIDLQTGEIHVYDPDNGLINEYFKKTIDYIKPTHTQNSIKGVLVNISTVLKFFKIQLPTLPDFKKQPKKWHLLTKEEIKYCLTISDLRFNAIITFMCSSGMRRADVVNLKISDFMKATYEYHKTTSVKKFLETAPQDMIGFWDFEPIKTQKYGIRCKTCNTPESSNLILAHLRERAENLKDRNADEMEATDPLFCSMKSKNYKKPLTDTSLTSLMKLREKKLKIHYKNLLNDKFEKGLITQEEYNEKIIDLPKFAPHMMRKFFITNVADNVANTRVSALLEGHQSPMHLDNSYVKISDTVIKDAYLNLIPCLSFENTSVDLLKTSEQEKLIEENKRLKAQLEAIEEATDARINVKLDEKQQEMLDMIEKAIKDSGLEESLKDFTLKLEK